jgi:hypothetical protein
VARNHDQFYRRKQSWKMIDPPVFIEMKTSMIGRFVP